MHALAVTVNQIGVMWYISVAPVLVSSHVLCDCLQAVAMYVPRTSSVDAKGCLKCIQCHSTYELSSVFVLESSTCTHTHRWDVFCFPLCRSLALPLRKRTAGSLQIYKIMEREEKSINKCAFKASQRRFGFFFLRSNRFKFRLSCKRICCCWVFRCESYYFQSYSLYL